jgi:uncharacterized protein YndB with AHSA1/START domain
MKFTIKTRIKTTPDKIYRAWLTSKGHAAMTGGDAKCSAKVGGKFTAWDEYISGKNLELIPDQYIKQSWRTVEFDPDQPDSLLEIQLKEIKPGITELTLTHSDLLAKDIKYKKGWVESYFDPMKSYFE